MHFTHKAIGARPGTQWVVRGLLIASLAATLGACTKTTERDVTGTIPNEYRQRHPITIGEKDRTLELFVGAGRGGLTPTPARRGAGVRAELAPRGERRHHHRPPGRWRQRSRGDGHAEAGVVDSRQRRHSEPRHRHPPVSGGRHQARDAEDQLSEHPREDAGPCGLWPKDLGPSNDPEHYENKSYYNLGCATQRNLAAMVDNPADLVQPRAETPAYQAKRTFGADKWRKGDSPATNYPDANKGAISDLGK